ncbi:glycerol-3-phosphate acyltransferase, chloroplastic [Rhododendron vialii]|uniref:glycerol-3-phosphate acyltransferase, chloroplastic n=1 Tax=Rhododendron vialii TaxID=182163 RepID=UPI00265EF189|nr:glycerol-3-phosphate acyltransferase, chloroplastic [Rhododendron vialii]
MLIPSASSPHGHARVSSPSSPSLRLSPFSKLGSISSSLPVRLSIPRRCPRAVLCCSAKSRGMAEVLKDSEPAAATSVHNSLSSSFLDVRTEEDLLFGIKKEAEAGRLPSNVARGMEELYRNYRNAVFESGIPNANEIVLSNMTVVLDRVFKDVEDPFVFSPYHRAIREPFDYYMFVKRYIRPLIDFRSSYVGNISVFREMEEKLQQGHNIVLISNHQSEADPAVIELLLEARHPHIAENMTFVAGDRVITDPLCKPFSMGRNLLCVYSKKHMNDVPELAEMKRKANTRSLKEMALLLRGGSQIIWIAPSGGRDRPDPITKEWYPAPFDAASVDNMRRLTEHAGVPGHIYPLAILCYDIMPPPPQVEKEIGESRVISFHGTGVSVAPAINFHEIDAACGDPEESKMAYTRALFDSVVKQYNVLNCAIHEKKGLEASVPTVSLSQPWN